MRANKIDSITPEAKQAARDAGIDKNQSALLKVAAAPVEEQVAMVEQVKVHRPPEPLFAPVAAAPDPEALIDDFVRFVADHVPDGAISELLRFVEAIPTASMAKALRRLTV